MDAIVMFTPPHYKVRGSPRLWMGRVDRAIKLALKYDCQLVIAGDANGGKDLDIFVSRARNAGVKNVVRAFNGHDPLLKNTRGDARMIASAVNADDSICQITIVTCWYHVPRAWVALRQELQREVTVRASPVWSKLVHGIKVLPNELRGCRDYLLGSPQRTRGSHIGKPDFSEGSS